MTHNNFDVSLQIFHPTADLSDVGKSLQLEVYRVWRAGSQRSTPLGRILDGTYDRSYLCLTLPGPPNDSISSKIETFVEQVAKTGNQKTLSDLRISGGELKLFVSADSIQETLNSTLLAHLGELGVSLSIDCTFDHGKSE